MNIQGLNLTHIAMLSSYLNAKNIMSILPVFFEEIHVNTIHSMNILQYFEIINTGRKNRKL